MTERILAQNIMRTFGELLVENLGGGTYGGNELMDAYCDMFNKAGGYNPMQIYDEGMALRHWIVCAGCDENGRFEYIVSNYIMNC